MDLASAFKVSEANVRKDLSLLEKIGLVKRIVDIADPDFLIDSDINKKKLIK